MASITVRGLGLGVKERLRVRAAQHGRSMEAEARELLQTTLIDPPPSPSRLSESIRQRFLECGAAELELAPRELPREPPKFR